MKIAVIGQSAFGADVYKLLKQNGHEIVGVFTIPDKNDREDILGEWFISFFFRLVDMFMIWKLWVEIDLLSRHEIYQFV